MLKILIQSAVIGTFAFALSVVALSAWRSFYSENHQTNQESSAENTAAERGYATSRVSTEERPDRAIASYTFWLMVFTAVLAIVGLIQIRFLIDANRTATTAARAAQRAANLARNQLILAYPPKLLITNVAIWPKNRREEQISLKPGQEIEGTAWVVNTGSDIATLKNVKCVTYWRTGNLPMLRPYDAPDGHTADCAPLKKPPDWNEATILQTGEIARWQLSAKVPQDYTDRMFFYVLGAVEHVDQLKVRHLTVFARKYIPGDGRFVAVENNHDYEGYE